MSPTFRTVVMVMIALTVAALASPGVAKVELVDSSDSGITLRYVPGELNLNGSDAGDGLYTDVSVGGAWSMGLEGAPALPVVTARVAVPYCESIGFEVVTAGSKTVGGVRVTPSPTTVSGNEGISATDYAEGAEYAVRALWPERAARLFGPSRLGTQRLAVVEFYPCQTDPVDETLMVHGSIEVRLSFEGRAVMKPARGERPRREALLQATLLNYEDGKRWRGRETTATGRPDGDYYTTSANWVRLTVREQGIYSVSYSDLQGIASDPSLIDPSSLRLFSGGGLPVPEAVTASRPTWMDECTIHVEGDSDGTFDPGDAVVFYAMATDGWVDELGADGDGEPYFESRFANANVYWLTWEMQGVPSGFSGEPLRMDVETVSSSPSPAEVVDYRAREHFEENVYEYQGKGDNWFWFEMKRAGSEERFFHEQLDHVVPDSTGLLRGFLRGNSTNGVSQPDHYALFYLNGVEVADGEWYGYSSFLFEGAGLPINEGYNSYRVLVPREDAAHAEDDILVDWFEIEYWRQLWTDTGQLRFGSSGRTGAIQYSIGGFTDNEATAFRVTGKYALSVIPGVTVAGGVATFQDDVSDSASYVIVAGQGYLTPTLIERATPGTLRTPAGDDYIMIVYDGFYDEAQRLADLRESDAGGGFQVRLVKVSEVYDEFSWGLVDPTAIRDYLKYTYENESIPPTHGLLIGDATSDYRQYLPSSAQTYVPTVYTGGSSYWPTDQWFVGFTTTTLYQPELAFGRLPVGSVSELRGVIDKIVRYETDSVQGTWKNTVLIIADDEFKFTLTDPGDCCEFFHTTQAESLDQKILPWPLDRKKVYLMEYERDLAGHKTEARNDIIKAWNAGALIVNWTGHGNETLMAHEYVFLFDDVARLTNIDALPLYFAASCRLNKFDMPTTDSLGEVLVTSRQGGSIASIGSTRDSGAGQNSVLNGWFYYYMFGEQRVETRPAMDIGSAFQAAFMEGTGWYNNTKFCIMGDPAVTLAAPAGGGSFDADGLEPLKRRDTVTVEGHNEGVTADASGIALLRVADSADTSGYLHTFPGAQRHVRYSLPGEPVFDGPVAVSGGDFSADLVVSALAEEGPRGRARAYFYGDEKDGAFSLENVSLADSVYVQDATGPTITIEFEGGGTSILPGVGLDVSLYDANGINLVNRDAEDGIILSFDGGADSQDLTDVFAYDLDSHERGTISMGLPSLSNGNHTVSISASDNMGNRVTESLSFEIVSTADFSIRNVANYPNPFPDGASDGTHILFQLPTVADVTIQIFTVGGRLIRVIDGITGAAGANQIYWDGLDQEGDEPANGVYLYRIYAVSKAYRGDKAEAIGRAVIMR